LSYYIFVSYCTYASVTLLKDDAHGQSGDGPAPL